VFKETLSDWKVMATAFILKYSSLFYYFVLTNTI